MMQDVCQIKGCGRKVAVKKHGLCKAHVNRMYWHGDPGEAEIKTRKAHPPFQAPKKKPKRKTVKK